MNRLRLQNLAGEYRRRLSGRAWPGKVTPVLGGKDQNFGCLYSVGSVDVTGTHAEDTTMTSYQDFSALVPARQSNCRNYKLFFYRFFPVP